VGRAARRRGETCPFTWANRLPLRCRRAATTWRGAMAGARGSRQSRMPAAASRSSWAGRAAATPSPSRFSPHRRPVARPPERHLPRATSIIGHIRWALRTRPPTALLQPLGREADALSIKIRHRFEQGIFGGADHIEVGSSLSFLEIFVVGQGQALDSSSAGPEMANTARSCRAPAPAHPGSSSAASGCCRCRANGSVSRHAKLELLRLRPEDHLFSQAAEVHQDQAGAALNSTAEIAIADRVEAVA